eukprot:jgi/Mesvir1/14953/Mv14625-RA.1
MFKRFRNLYNSRRYPQNDAVKRKFILGVCAMEKKTSSKPMEQILKRLTKFEEFEVVKFTDEMILTRPVEEWPKCEALISFFSEGFPLPKAEAYVKLRKPFVFNSLETQYALLDRRRMYTMLVAAGIPTPTHIIVTRDDGHDACGNLGNFPINDDRFREEEEYVELDGVKIQKPFVEKPVDGEDHCINIYYPRSAGGGMKTLFRKTGDRSSLFHPEINSVRRKGSYIYETFMPTGGTDVKVYAVGPDYAHAEARKSPVVDGRVLRTASGKEVRYPVLLTPDEKDMARLVVEAFQQNVCGFDLLRSNGASYVCDVNGWSFVKNSQKYYDDTALCLRNMVLQALAPDVLARNPIPVSLLGMEPGECGAECSDDDANELVGSLRLGDAFGSSKFHGSFHGSFHGTISGKVELRAIMAVIRHGDRTPKQKMKMKVTHSQYLDILHKYNGGNPHKEAKLKTPDQLQELLDATRQLLGERIRSRGGAHEGLDEAEHEEELLKLKHVKAVLEEGGHFSGINRKVQLKPLKWKQEGTEGPEVVVQALLVLKYGGVLTHAGRKQAEILGQKFRSEMYPGEAGLLRLHSTYRHDLKIYSSDEGRVQMSAAAFTKGLLDLEGPLTPILVSLVSKDPAMLDGMATATAKVIESCKAQLCKIMTGEVSSKHKDLSYLTPTTSQASSPTTSFRRPPRGVIMPEFSLSPHSANMGVVPGAGGVESSMLESVLDGIRTVHVQEGYARNIPPAPRAMLHRLVILIGNLVAQLRLLRQEEEDAALFRSRFSEDKMHRREGATGSDYGGDLDIEELDDNKDEEQSPYGDDSSKGNPFSDRDNPSEHGGAPAAALLAGLHAHHSQDKTHEQAHLTMKPCGGESFLLMEARWVKLKDEIYHERKGVFDISKIPDIYDSIKYDLVHNSHLNLYGMDELYRDAKALADGVIQNEYGIDPVSKLTVGSQIARPLLKKVLIDMNNTRKEGLELLELAQEASVSSGRGSEHLKGGNRVAQGPSRVRATTSSAASLPDAAAADSGTGGNNNASSGSSDSATPSLPKKSSLGIIDASAMAAATGISGGGRGSTRNSIEINGTVAASAAAVGGGGEGGGGGAEGGGAAEGGAKEEVPRPSVEDKPVEEKPYKLDHRYAKGVKSPLRHVRTRLYFTSESHIHSLINTLRYCFLDSPGGTHLLSETAEDNLSDIREYDYLTQIVFEMYENMEEDADDHNRFQIKISFSPGSAVNPLQVVPRHNDHTLPTVDRVALNTRILTLEEVEAVLGPYVGSSSHLMKEPSGMPPATEAVVKTVTP